ncbi:MAG: penicillin-binding protein 2, partial [Actinomycetota bacterium]|nr:penicillin-binding protein 2 [Actinomycetota bacterium]
PAPRRLPNLRSRLVALLVVLGMGFGALVVRLVDVQGISASRYAVMGQSQRLQRVDLPAQRGSIVDRNGADLAVSVPRFTVWADPRLVNDPAADARALGGVLGLDAAEIRRGLTAESAFVYLARRVDDATAEKVRALNIPGVSLMPEPTRVSPSGAVGASVLGHVGADNEGLSGLERQYERELAGTEGEMLVERDPSGRDIAGGVRENKRPVRGEDLVLTLDRDLQFSTEQALGDQIAAAKAKSGIAVLMDPRTGEILAMANMVAGDPGRPPQRADYNKALIDVYEPGSVTKIVTMAGALQEDAVTPSETFAVPDRLTVAGTTFHDAESHPTHLYTPGDVMAESSNSGAILIAQRLGKAGLDKYLRAFGLDGDTGLDFPGEASGMLPQLEDWSGTSLPTLAIGYGLAVNAVQMLAAYNTIANGGVYVAPSLVRSRIGPDAKERRAAPPKQRRVVSAETAAEVTAMLAEVVRSGTGKPAAVDGYTVAGKTGTARKVEESLGYKEGAYVASFAGFLPAEAPRLSAIVVLDQPQPYTGGLASGPVFAQLAGYAVRHFQVPATAAEEGGPTGEALAAAATLRPSSATRP